MYADVPAMKATDYIASYIENQGVPYVFGYVGGMIAHLVDSIFRSPKIDMVNTLHEQGAGFAADAFARMTGKTGVALATSGPGATNLLTPVADCFFDSIPAVFITGQVNTFEYRKFPAIRQNAFQETDIVSIARPITKYSVMIEDVSQLRYELEKAFYIAQEGRKGPVLLDIPMDIQRSEYDFSTAVSYLPEVQQKADAIQAEAHRVAEKLLAAEKPLLLLGHGVRLSGGVEKVRRLLERSRMPVVQSLLGVDCVTADYEWNLGLIGTYGNRGANIALSSADVLLVLGSRLDIRQIGVQMSVFAGKEIIQVDIDPRQLECDNLKKDTIHASVDAFAEALLCEPWEELNIGAWRNRVTRLRGAFPSWKNIDGAPLMPNVVLSGLFEALQEDDVVCTDVGQHQLWAAQSAQMKGGMRMLTSGGLGSMGFSLPAAIGAAMSGHRAIVISGDGGFQMNIQELETIKRRGLPIKIVIMNNSSLGMIRQFQDDYFAGRHASSIVDYSTPDFEKVAEAYGISGYTKAARDLTPEFWAAFLADDTPALVNVLLEQDSKLFPKTMFGHAIHDMYPFLPAEEIAKLTE